jgi:hypothetical protein
MWFAAPVRADTWATPRSCCRSPPSAGFTDVGAGQARSGYQSEARRGYDEGHRRAHEWLKAHKPSLTYRRDLLVREGARANAGAAKAADRALLRRAIAMLNGHLSDLRKLQKGESPR